MLLKALHGTRAGPDLWHEFFAKTAQEFGCKRFKANVAYFVHPEGLELGVRSDDGEFFAGLELGERFVAYLKERLLVKVEGPFRDDSVDIFCGKCTLATEAGPSLGANPRPINEIIQMTGVGEAKG
eukprot:37199-Alexandrium_andersonii.AAC.1